MATFSEVFSITVKVLLALILLSLLLGATLGVIGLLGWIASPHHESASAATDWDQVIDRDKADNFRSSVPSSKWNRAITRAKNHHCFFRGMTKDEVLSALGAPSEKQDFADNGSAWTWTWQTKKCLRYDGEHCAEYDRDHQIVFFTPKGHVDTKLEDCESLNGDYIFNSDLFGAGSWN